MNDPEPTPQPPPPPEPPAADIVPATPPPPPGPSTPPPPASNDFLGNVTGKQWAMFLHFGQFAGYLVPGLGFAAPIVIWQLYKDKFPELDAHGKMVTNWMLSLLIYSVVAFLLSLITCGFGAILFIPLGVASIVFAVIGGIKANEGVLWNYPLTIPFIK